MRFPFAKFRLFFCPSLKHGAIPLFSEPSRTAFLGDVEAVLAMIFQMFVAFAVTITGAIWALGPFVLPELEGVSSVQRVLRVGTWLGAALLSFQSFNEYGAALAEERSFAGDDPA